jgi:site-specific DNA-methyltransferase (adenine-specific)
MGPRHKSDALVSNYKSGALLSKTTRPLLTNNSGVFIRYNEAVSILNKIQQFNDPVYSGRVSSRKPFGLDSNFSNFSKISTKSNNITLYKVGGVGYINEKDIPSNKNLTKKIKVLVSKSSPGGDTYPHKVISSPIVALPDSCCTETYLIVDVVQNLKQAENLKSYMSTSFFRFLMSLVKNTQNISRGVFCFVPIQNLDEEWTDEKLYKKYEITKDEQRFIDTLIRPMV